MKPPAQALCVRRPAHSRNVSWGGAGGVGERVPVCHHLTHFLGETEAQPGSSEVWGPGELGTLVLGNSGERTELPGGP